MGKKVYDENMITTMTIRIVERDKTKFNNIKGKVTQHVFLNTLLNMYECNIIKSILLKSHIKIDDINRYIEPKKYVVKGDCLYKSDTKNVWVNIKDLYSSISKDINIACDYKFSVFREADRYLVYEEFSNTDELADTIIRVKRCKIAKSIGEVLSTLNTAYNNIISYTQELELALSDRVSDDCFDKYI